MRVELKVPEVGESVTEAIVGPWQKKEGEVAKRDEVLVEIESDKATVEVLAESDGKVVQILKQQGETAQVGEVIGYLEEVDAAEAASSAAPTPPPAEAAKGDSSGGAAPAAQPAATATASPRSNDHGATSEPVVMPAAQRMLSEHNLSPADVQATGPGGRLLKEDVQRHLERGPISPAGRELTPQPTMPAAVPQLGRETEVVPMTGIRRRIAARLVEAQQNAALLTTFNEIDMTNVMAVRKQHRDAFQEKHGVKLGFMSFFVRAVIESLKLTPQLNAQIRGNDIVYHNYYDIGIAVGSGKGLVVPILRNAERMSFADVEKTIGEFAKRAAANKIAPDELQGGTFTISNGGVYGSLLSTPIVNPPQSGILGLHAIQERPIALNGQVVIRPMMYIALTYDHRIVDGREAVTFLKQVKSLIEDPTRVLLEI